MQNANCKGKGGVIQLPFWHVDEQGLMQIYSITHDSCVEVHNKISHIRTTLIVPNSALSATSCICNTFENWVRPLDETMEI